MYLSFIFSTATSLYTHLSLPILPAMYALLRYPSCEYKCYSGQHVLAARGCSLLQRLQSEIAVYFIYGDQCLHKLKVSQRNLIVTRTDKWDSQNP